MSHFSLAIESHEPVLCLKNDNKWTTTSCTHVYPRQCTSQNIIQYYSVFCSRYNMYRHQLRLNSSGGWRLAKPPYSKCSECMLRTPVTAGLGGIWHQSDTLRQHSSSVYRVPLLANSNCTYTCFIHNQCYKQCIQSALELSAHNSVRIPCFMQTDNTQQQYEAYAILVISVYHSISIYSTAAAHSYRQQIVTQ